MKKTRLFGLVVGFALIAAACGGGVDFEAGPLGAVEVGPDEQIQIRSLQAITGDVAFLGIPNQRGIELAITDFGDIEGHSVTIGTGLDDLCTAEGGQAAAQTITADDKVVGVIGTSCSGAAAAASPLISDAGMVMISPSNTSPSLTSDLKGTAGKDYRPGYYRTAHNDLFQGQAVAEFAYNNLEMRKAAAIHDGDPYTDGLATAFSDAFQGLGGEMVVYTSVNKGDTDMSAVLTEVAAGSPDMLFFPIFPAEGIPIAQQIGGIPGLENITLIAADGLLVDNFLEIPEASGIYHSGPDLNFGNNTSPTGTNAEAFLAAYEAAYGETPTAPFWAHSYDATIMLLTAIEKVAVVDGDTIFIDRQLLRDELDKTSGFSGIIGTITCDDFGDCGAQRIAIILNNSPNDLDTAKANVVFLFSP